MSSRLHAHLARIYVAAMIAAGAVVLVVLLTHQGGYVTQYAPLAIMALAVGVVIGETFPVKLGPDKGEVAPSTTFAFALLLTAGISVAVLAQAIACVVADVRDGKPAVRTAFNAAQYTIALWLASLVLAAAGHTSMPAHFGLTDIALLGLAGIAFFVFNAAAVTTAVALHSGTPLRNVINSDLTFHAGTEAILLGLAPLAVLAVDYSPALLPLVVLPLLAINRAGKHAVLNERLALHDTLTDLPNRVLFRDRAGLAITAGTRHGNGVSLMLIDLDRFKEINDALGHHVGDEVLRIVAARMRETLREVDTVARLGGDEFAVLLDAGSDDPGLVAEKLRVALSRPMEVRGIPLLIGASIGIASSPEDGGDVETLMQRADVAMYQAKASDDGVCAYASERDDSSVARLTMAAALRRAIDDDAIEVHFQPQFDARSGAVTGVEALARWHHEGAWIPPDEFIPVAEQTGLIVPLTDRVLQVTVRELARWLASGIEITAAVNLSARSLIRGSLPDRVAAICRLWDVRPQSLILEVTETMVAADPRTTVDVIERLAASGTPIAIDDFGTGFSSLEVLRSLPLSLLKLDRGFVTGMGGDVRDQAIIASTIALGHRLGLQVIAEGVETAEVRAQLSLMGCDTIQGFLLGEPAPAGEIARLHARCAVAASDAERHSA